VDDQDPAAFDLLQKVSEFINNDVGAYKIILTAVMESMCIGDKSHALDDEKCKQCEEMASLFLEQMQANSKKITEKDKTKRFSPQILWLALAVYTRSPIGYEELCKSSIEVMPSQSTLAHLKSQMQTTDGICPEIYQCFYNDTVHHIPELERAGHIMCDEMQLKSGIYWNTLSHKLVGFASDSNELNLAKEIEILNNLVDGKIDEKYSTSECSESLDTNNVKAKKVNQWHFRSIKGVIHNAEYFFNSGSLTGNELMHQFMHVVSCYKAIGVQILGCICDAGGQNSQLFNYLQCLTPLDDNSWLSNDCVLVKNPAIPSQKIAVWFCATHQLKNMCNALLNASSKTSKHMFVNDGTPITWQFLEDTYKADCR